MKEAEETYLLWKLSQKMKKSFRDIASFVTHPFGFCRDIKHCDQPLSTTLIYFDPIEIYSEKKHLLAG